MQYSEVISQIKERCRAINMTPRSAFVEAGADPAQFYKWEHGMSPTARVFNREVGKVEHFLAERERAMFLTLAGRFLPEADVDELRALIDQAAGAGVVLEAGGFDRAGAGA